MPYTREKKGSDWQSAALYQYDTNGVVVDSIFHSNPERSADTTGFRTRFTRGSSEVPDHIADPYGWFLTNRSKKQYLQNLKALGLPPEDSQGSDNGHSFSTQSFRSYGTSDTIIEQDPQRRIARLWSDGYFVPSNTSWVSQGPFNGGIDGPAVFPSSDLDNFAQRAYNKTRPTPAAFDLTRFLGELREGLPRLSLATFRSRAEVFKNLGDDYLNVNFGWLPFVSDLKAAAQSLLDSDSVFNRLPSQGRSIRRSWGLPARIDYASFKGLGVNPIIGFNSLITSGRNTYADVGYQAPWTVTKRLFRRQWFDGKYTMFYPVGFDSSNYLDRLSVLIKTDLTPETLWELSPWTWLIDWALHIGDSIEANLNAQDERVFMHYGYAMEQTEATASFTASFQSATAGYFTLRQYPNFVSRVAHTVWKRRIRANPYGFTASSLGSLLPGQIATLAALGLSRS